MRPVTGPRMVSVIDPAHPFPDFAVERDVLATERYSVAVRGIEETLSQTDEIFGMILYILI